MSNRFGWLAVLALGATILPATSGDPEVRHRGALREILHGGDSSSRIGLAELAGVEHLWGLGAVEGLSGEILILDGRPWVSAARDGAVRTESTSERGAALLVWAAVDAWTETAIPPEIATLKQLERFVATSAGEPGRPGDRAFPFRLEGTAARIDWHVIDRPAPGASHEQHRTSGPHGVLEEAAVRILGFHSTRHAGVFTHHDSTVHMHVLAEPGPFAAHVDDLRLDGRMRLLLPAAPVPSPAR